MRLGKLSRLETWKDYIETSLILNQVQHKAELSCYETSMYNQVNLSHCLDVLI